MTLRSLPTCPVVGCSGWRAVATEPSRLGEDWSPCGGGTKLLLGLIICANWNHYSYGPIDRETTTGTEIRGVTAMMST
jgi:hypothetical protein